MHDGSVYEGAWKQGYQDGFGTLMVPIEPIRKQTNNPDSVLSSKSKPTKFKLKEPLPPNQLRKVYAGEWAKGKREGYGSAFYDHGAMYEGHWKADKRCGWGKMTYANEDVYEGEWYDEKRHGQGILLYSNSDTNM
jgi:hypothetical protein